MIKYALGCAEGHAFESWFPDSAAYEKQRKRGFVACPECGSTEVDKAIMAPAVVGGERSAAESSPPIVVDDRQNRTGRLPCEYPAELNQALAASDQFLGGQF